jgi:hypothetical protein
MIVHPSSDLATLVVETNFDPNLEANQRLPRELRKNPTQNYLWTEQQRKLASNATCPTTLVDFQEEVCIFTVGTGYISYDEKYVKYVR